MTIEERKPDLEAAERAIDDARSILALMDTFVNQNLDDGPALDDAWLYSRARLREHLNACCRALGIAESER